MRSLQNKKNSILILVILLTQISACALINPKSNALDRDPITRAANQERQKQENVFSSQRNPKQVEFIKRSIASNRLAVGMKMKEVQMVWGHPRKIENAGDPESGNQKWIYPEGISNQWDIYPSHYVYFVDGLVTGWGSAP